MNIALMLAASSLILSTAPMSAADPPRATTVEFRNELPSSYGLERVRMWVDGALRYDGARPFATSLPFGAHIVSISAEYRMSDPILSYMRDYRVEARAAERVESGAEAPILVVARAVPAGGVTTPVQRRVQIVWRTH